MSSLQNKRTQGRVPSELSGQRLDVALKWLLPAWSLRKRRTIWEMTRVFVDNKPRNKGYKVKTGQWVSLDLARNDSERQAYLSSFWPEVRIIAESDGLAAVYKPAGLHCQELAYGGYETLEAALADMFPAKVPVMLNRLDKATSGLVLVGLDNSARSNYSRLQQGGKVVKSYWVLVQGKLQEEKVLKWQIDSVKRRKVRVSGREDQSYLRWTRVHPVKLVERDKTLVRAQILKGQRHQIRAHLAFAGFPIVGDALYGQASEADELMFLHHYQVSMPGFSVKAQPDWPGFDFDSEKEWVL